MVIRRRHIRVVACMFIASSFLASMVPSQTNATVNTSGISQGFHTKETNIVTGALMSLDPNDKDSVVLANTDRVAGLVGVVGDKSLLALSNNTPEVQVAIGGTTEVLVSDINGVIHAGDRITASPIDGIGMKAVSSTQVVGTAQNGFNLQDASARTVADATGAQHTVHIGLVSVQINVSYYSPDTNQSIVPPFLQQLANYLAGGRQVSILRIIASLFVFLLAFVSITALLVTSVRSSIISIGRNPLSEVAVRKGLLEVGLTSIGILLGSVAIIYLILRI